VPLLLDWKVEMSEQMGRESLPRLTPDRRIAMRTRCVETPWEHHRFLWYQSWTYNLPRGQGKHLMLRRSVLESNRSPRHTSVVLPHGHQLMANRSWSHCVHAIVLCVLSLAWTVQGVAAADPAGFARHDAVLS